MAKRRSSRSQTATFLPEAVLLKFDQKLVLLRGRSGSLTKRASSNWPNHSSPRNSKD